MKRPKNNNSMSQAHMASKFDLWLSRSSHISQTVLTIITVASLFFVVIPIYQNELLSESIAKKELQLTSLQANIEEAYKFNSTQNVKTFLATLAFTCSNYFLTKIELNESNQREIDALNFNVGNCWSDKLEKAKSRLRLRDKDFNSLRSKLTLASSTIESMRIKYKKEYDEFSGPPVGYEYESETKAAVDSMLKNILTTEEFEAARQNRNFNAARRAILLMYLQKQKEEVERLIEEWSNR